MPAAADMISALAPLSDAKRIRCFRRLSLFQLFDHPADFPVHGVDHRSVNGHLGRLESLLLCGQLSRGTGCRSPRGQVS